MAAPFGRLYTSGCRSLSQTFGNTFFGLVIVDNPPKNAFVVFFNTCIGLLLPQAQDACVEIEVQYED